MHQKDIMVKQKKKHNRLKNNRYVLIAQYAQTVKFKQNNIKMQNNKTVYTQMKKNNVILDKKKSK